MSRREWKNCTIMFATLPFIYIETFLLGHNKTFYFLLFINVVTQSDYEIKISYLNNFFGRN